MWVRRQPVEYARRSVGELLAVDRLGLSRERGSASRRKHELDEHAHLAFVPRAVVQLRRYHTTAVLG